MTSIIHTEDNGLFSKKIAEKAIEIVTPAIIPIIKDRGDESNGLLPNGNGLIIYVGDIHGKILAARRWDSTQEWFAPYDQIALSKFNLTVETRKPSREIQSMTPELANSGRYTYYWGSDIDGGIVVACSGVDPEWDEAICKMICAAIRAMVTKQIKQGSAEPGKHFRDGFD